MAGVAYAIAGGDGGADTEVEFGGRDDGFTGEVTATFCEDLIFDVEGGDAGAGVLLNGAGDVGWAAEAGAKKKG